MDEEEYRKLINKLLKKVKKVKTLKLIYAYIEFLYVRE